MSKQSNFPDELKPKLVPVKVPWQVSPSTPNLQLAALESSSFCEVKLVAYFALGEEKIGMLDNVPSDFFQCLKLTFEGEIWIKMSPAYEDINVIDESIYDWSAVTFRYTPRQDPERWIQQFRNEWRRTFLCPNPRMYEVEWSSWLEETGIENHESKHYLILGHDAYIEILAETWKWESEKVLEDW